MKKKLIASALILANVISLASCKSTAQKPSPFDDDDDDADDRKKPESIEEGVFGTVDEIAQALAECDYDAFRKHCTSDPVAIEEAMPIVDESTEKAGKQDLVENMIASTITYEIDKDSYKSNLLGASSVDVTFSYKDYRKAAESKEGFINPGDFKTVLDDVSETVDFTFNLKFQKNYDDFYLLNPETLVGLYDYKDTELNYISIFDMVDDIYITGPGYDEETDSYYATDTFEIVLVLNPEASKYVWQYRYRVSIEQWPEWEHLYRSEKITERNPTEIRVTYTADHIFEDGFYVILFYNYYDDTIIGMEFDVYKDTKEVVLAGKTDQTTETTAETGDESGN